MEEIRTKNMQLEAFDGYVACINNMVRLGVPMENIRYIVRLSGWESAMQDDIISIAYEVYHELVEQGELESEGEDDQDLDQDLRS